MSSVAVEMFLTGVMVLTPTIMFIGFYRGLIAMRDDDLINELMMNDDVQPPENRTMAKAMGLEEYYDRHHAQPSEPASQPAPGTTRCRHCSAENPEHVDFCAICLQRL